jgi:hypothetical protein
MADKRKLLKDADEAYSELIEAVAGLSDLEMGRVWLGTWGVREILIHIAAWDREMIPALERVGRGEPPYAPGTYDDGDAWNARFVEARLGANAPGILAELAANHAAFVAAASALPEAAYLPNGGAAELVTGTTTGHYREHAEQVRGWREEEQRHA